MSDYADLIDDVSQTAIQRETLINTLFAQTLLMYARRYTSTALTWAYYGGRLNGSTLANGTVSATDAATNYVVANRSTLAVSISTSNTNWNDTTTYGRLYKLTASGGAVTDWEDHRFGSGGIFQYSSGAFTGGTLSSALNEAPIATIASASTVNIGAAAANTISISGTTTITAFDSIASGARRLLHFQGALTLTHNGTSLILPTGANITTAAGDCAAFVSLGSGNWRCTGYMKANGTPLVSTSAMVVLSPAYAATVTVDLTSYTAYPIVVVNVGTLTGNVTFNITNGSDGQIVRARFTQDGTGSRTFTAGGNLRFSTDTPSPTLTTTAGAMDRLAFEWHAGAGKADLIAVNKGY